jgi:hypothetical protein
MDKVFLVMEYVDHDMKVLLKQMDERKKKFKIGKKTVTALTFVV